MSTVSAPPGLLGTIAAKRREFAIGLGASAVLFAALTVWWGVWGWKGRQALDKPAVETKADDPFADSTKAKDEPKPEAPAGKVRSPDYLPFAAWALLNAVLAGGAAAWLYTQPLTPGNEADTARAEVLTVGALAGLITALLGFVLGVGWRDSLFKWVNDGSTKEAKWVLIAASIFTLGLVVMFLSLQLGRTQERSSAVLRRMLYGFNSVFLGLLLLMVLVAVNVVSYLKVPNTLLTTDRAFTELSEPSKEFLRKLDKPVHVYLVVPEKYTEPIQTRAGGVVYDRLYSDCQVLLDQCADQTNLFQSTYLSPALDTARIAALRTRLGVKTENPDDELVGMIVSVGEDEKAVGFIPVNELIEVIQVGRAGFVVFQAENRLLTEIAYRADTRENEVIYFTQDNDELSMTGGPRSMSNVLQVLRDRKVRVEPLQLDDKKTDIPADAAVVVVAGPQNPFAPDGRMTKALRAYLRPAAPDVKPGKLLAYLPAIRGARGEVVPTGLESLVAEFGIQVAPDRRIVTGPESVPLGQGRGGLVYAPPDSAYVGAFGDLQLPLRDTLAAGRLLMKNCRPVQTAPPGPGGPRTYALMGTQTRRPTWQEKDWATAAAAVYRQFREAPDEATLSRLLAERQYSETSVSVAAAAAEPNSDPAKPERPRAIVFGSDSPLVDRQDVDLRNDEYRAQVLAASLDWLREKDVNLGIPPRKTHSFQLGKGPELTGLFMLLAIMVVGISGLGLGVWLSRRR